MPCCTFAGGERWTAPGLWARHSFNLKLALMQPFSAASLQRAEATIRRLRRCLRMRASLFSTSRTALPRWLAGWTGIRIDSGDPATAANIAIDWWKSRGEDPTKKRVIFSDGLDVDKIKTLHGQFADKTNISFGWGTLLTNDFRGLVPNDALAPFSLVCKAVSANGHPTVKLSDNPRKAMGPQDQIDRYKRVFGVGDQVAEEVVV